MFGDLARRRGVRAGEPARPAPEVEQRSRRRAGRCSSPGRRVGRLDPARRTGRATPRGTAFVMWTSGTTGDAEADPAHARGVPRAARPRARSAARRASRDPATPADAEPHRRSSLALNAGIYNVLFGLRAGAPIVVMDGFEPARVRRARAPLRDPLDGAAAGGDHDARRRPGRRRPRAAALRAQHHRAALAGAGPPLPRQVRGRRAQRLRPGRDRRGDRLDRGRRPRAPREDRRGRAGPHPGVRSRAIADPDADGVGRLLVRPPSIARSATAPTTRSPTASTPTASSTPATSPASTPTASCGSRAGPAT